jgi:long-subunit fatty acid transport protein
MKFLVVFFLSFSQIAFASLPELFGQSTESLSLGNQAQKESAANNYQAPALQGYSKTTQFSFDTFYVSTVFKDIQNIYIKNSTNTVNTLQRGNAKVNATPSTLMAAHLSTPLIDQDGPKLNFSLFAPLDRLMEADSGDPYLPRYVMYQNRFLRPLMLFSIAQSFNDWSFAFGAQSGFQSTGEAYFITRTTPGSPSLAKISFNAKPSWGATVSVAKKYQNQVTHLTFQQEMKSKLTNRATGETEVFGAGVGQFDFDLTSLLYYDPMILRLGHQVHLDHQNLFFALEFQEWDHFQSSTLNLKKLDGTINGSKNYENIKTKNIFIPKVGYEHKLSEHWSAKLGYFYRQSPIDTNNLKNSGNSIDCDKHVASIGIGHKFLLRQKVLGIDLAYQSHFLKTHKILKTANREDGDPSEPKIGSPGYQVGGMIHVLSLGLNWKY